jgi:hypothetical protein
MFCTVSKPEKQAVFPLKVIQFSLVNNMLDPLASNISGFLKTETVLLPFT